MASLGVLWGRLTARHAQSPQTAARDGKSINSADLFDNIARLTQRPIPRRSAVGTLFGGFLGLALADLGIKSAWAQANCLCTDGETYDPAIQCCTSAGVQAKNPITNLAACPNRVPHPGHTPGFNGCGPANSWITPWIPNRYGIADFTQCCNNHDICYDTCNDVKSNCDNAFLSCLTASCNNAYSAASILFPELLQDCLVVAGAYYAAVALGGGSAFDSAQDEACDCCPETTCPQSCAGSSCGSLPPCAGGGDCVCFTSTEGNGACIHGDTPCDSVPNCVTSADCPAGYACTASSCCGSAGFCGPLCNPITGPSGQTTRQIRKSATKVRTMGGF
jgi:hypothetical protein